ncbi:MAG: hypothetical protein NTY15_02455 [Planctomycetota bacterium]|nr:hypothetical protein [Planctomycetota bacterium]
MASFREQMQQLADSISRTRNERKTFVVKNRKRRQKMAIEVSQQRETTKRELAMQSRTLAKSLSDFNRNNKKSVSRSLKDTRQGRLAMTRSMKHLLREEISKNSRNVARLLRQSNSDRKRNQRLRIREGALTMQRVKKQVQRIRMATNRMTRSLSNDRYEARQIWNRLQLGTSASRPASRIADLHAEPPRSNTSRNPVYLAPTTPLSISGLAIPPSPF